MQHSFTVIPYRKRYNSLKIRTTFDTGSVEVMSSSLIRSTKVDFLQSTFFQIRQEASHQSQQRHKSAYIINRLDTVCVRHTAKYSRSDTRNAERKPEEQTGNQSQLIGQQFLRIQ